MDGARSHGPAGFLRAALAWTLPDLGRSARLQAARGAAQENGGRVRAPAPGREEQRRILREWEVLRERLTEVAGRRLADAGELLSDARFAFTPGREESAAARDYAWAVDAYQAAGKLLDEAADLPDLAAVVVLADRAVERFAAAHARHEGRRPPAPVVRCFYNPLHGAAVAPPQRRGKGGHRHGRLSQREAAAARRPACESCRLAILAGQTPDVLPALWTVGFSRLRRAKVLVPYYAVPQQASLWSATGCGAYDDNAPAQVLRGEHRRRGPGR